jgi:rod shape-determining protein MreB
MALSKEIGIDLGTANILIYRKGEGIVVNEPSVVTINTETNRAVAVGEEAREMLGKTPGKLQAIRPLKDGVIADFQITEILLTHFINKLNLKGLFSRPTILICCPSNITSIEKSAIQDVALRCGAKKVYIEEEPKVAAIGAGLLKTEEILEGVARLRISNDIEFEEETFIAMMDEAREVGFSISISFTQFYYHVGFENKLYQ